MKVAILGQGWLATEVLHALGRIPALSIVAASPEKTDDRFMLALKHTGVPVIPNLKHLPHCDLMVAAHCHRYIGAGALLKARHGILAYHPSLLPRHRGRNAIHWTLAMRDPIAGGSVYLMDDGVDTGDIVCQDWCHVLPNDTPQTLWRRSLGPMGVRLLTQAVTWLVRDGTLHTMRQDERCATWEPALAREPLKNTI
ncbi:Formyltetrahydrofolate dehydrogenase [Oleidesulfovibrio alaskensis G20]|uniref:Formyltetrahydrofolate dehydrogenase n=1 Tax=Oleidesulfovibrio alaskensis (strain ATCC BAA-1058 / DSM 17464 / G20) TaxID=207559 RepID=Q30VV5_OLEA2|nr:formyltransferase family protein [Oleidesulfovibrio alaskensis]ABB40191.1 Formyltetrahydrofolate dehydrogenase [Oleidesulfovibrio alaskensis G20]MBL3580841.1 methionyl-tRNA formyltransferase [Oleidesulfovibrio alaskensis]MBL3587918.1 methionyl-tRNA formyltransferase [bacterium]